MSVLLVKNEATTSSEKSNASKTTFNNSSTSSTATLYNFGYAPKHIIEKFQEFCYDHITLADAINALLERDSLLIKKYRFQDCSVSFQMLARPTKLDKAHLVRSAVLALHKYTREGRFKSVADAIEELLLSPLLNNFADFSDNTTSSDICEYSELSLLEQNALTKIADALIMQMNKIENSMPASRVISTVKTQKQKSAFTPYPKKKPQVFAKSLLSMDPDYDPVPGKNKTILTQSSWPQAKEITLMKSGSFLDEKREEPVDIEMLIPIKRLAQNFSQPKKSRVVQRQKALAKTAGSRKCLFMLNQLELIVNTITSNSKKPNNNSSLFESNLLQI